MGRYMKYKFILTTLLSGYAFVAMAQANPVLVSDEITAGKFKNMQLLSTFAQYACGGILLQDEYIPMTKDCAIYVKSSSGVALHSISVEVLKSSGYNGEISIYGKNNAYSGFKDFYNGFEGSLIGKIKFSKTDNLQSITSIPQDYRYWGIAHIQNDSNISKITVTWKLAYSRENVTPNNLGTICLPYNVEKEQLEGVTLYDIVGKTSTNEKEAIVCEEVDHIEAGKPYLFTSTSDALFLLYSNESSYTTEQKGTNGFYGNFTATTAGALRGGETDDIYVVSGNAIKKAGDAVNIGANRAYIRRSELPVLTSEPASQSQRRYVLTEDGFAPYGDNCLTSGSLLQDSSFAPSSSVYDVHGRRVSATHRGIVVQEGRVVLH